MDFMGDVSKLAEAPIVALLVIVVLALVWTLTKVLVFLPRIPLIVVDAMGQAGERTTAAFKHTVEDLQDTIRELQRDLHEERERVDDANGEILSVKRHLLAVDQDRRRALAERDEWRDKARELEGLVKSLEAQVDQLSRQIGDLTGRMKA